MGIQGGHLCGPSMMILMIYSIDFHSRRLDPPTLCCWEGTRFDPERRACEDDPDVRWNKAGAGSQCFREMDAKLIHKIY